MYSLALIIGIIGLAAFIYIRKKTFFADEKNVPLWIVLFLFLPFMVMGMCIAMGF